MQIMREMKYLMLLVCTIAYVQSQSSDVDETIADVFDTNGTRGRNTFELVEVTTRGSQSIGAIDPCGEGADKGKHICVRYFQCDGQTKMVLQDGRTDGFGVIDIRSGENNCPHFLDVCCGIPNNTVIKEPTVTDPSVSPTPVTPSSTSVPVTIPTPRPSSQFCGIRNPNGIDFKITGNQNGEAEYGEFPWVTAILNTNPIPGQNLAICAGSLIAPNVVLTAAHCVESLKVDQYKVRVGEWDSQTESERLPYQERAVTQAIIHPEYQPHILFNDIALLILQTPIDQADNVGTICLPEQDEVSTSKNCFVNGWGKDVFGKQGLYQSILKKIELPMVQNAPCQTALRSTRLGNSFKLHPSFICAGGEAGKDACTGDGGGPLVCPDPKKPGRYIQTGIVAWGIGCGEQNVPGVYADVAKFRTWVDSKLAELNIKVAA